ncbi:MAG: acyl-CoA dehydrogenase family protein [Flavobacteriaceae bacterium]
METQTNGAVNDFRMETRAWLEAHCPESMRNPVQDFKDMYWGGRNPVFHTEDQKIWFERMLKKRWIVPQWEKKYGGGGLTPEENNILTEEMTRLGCRRPLYSFGISMLGPALLKFANEDQKNRYLNQIVKGEIWWCQGYSEPNAGSDLASLQTKAIDKGDHYEITGSKVWTSYADKADWIFCLVRTDFEATKHNGISFLLIDMASEGVSTRPIKLISGKSPFCETFFDGVKVPKENLIGTLNEGWTIAKYLLTHERQMIGGIGETEVKRQIHEIALESIPTDEKGRLEEINLRKQISDFEMDEEIFDLTIRRVTDEAKTGNNTGALSSFFKYYATELNMARHELLLEVNGFNSLIWEENEKSDGDLARKFCRTKGNSIEGGTSEIQLNIISKLILGLPTR